MIAFDGVTKRYPDGTVAVDDLSLDAPTGQITVLVGPSGCGKTTSLRMVNRMIEPTSGAISLDGRDTARDEATPSCAAASATSSSTPACSRTARSSTTSRTVPRLLGWDRKRTDQRAPWSCSSGSGCRPAALGATRRSSPAASSSASVSPARSPPTRR